MLDAPDRSSDNAVAMPAKHGALIVVGSGPGIGQHVATEFAQRGFEKIILMSRNKQRLPQDADAVRSTCPATNVEEIILDAADPKSVADALREADRSLESTQLECVLYNSARPGTSHFFEFSEEDFQADLRVCIDLHRSVLQ